MKISSLPINVETYTNHAHWQRKETHAHKHAHTRLINRWLCFTIASFYLPSSVTSCCRSVKKKGNKLWFLICFCLISQMIYIVLGSFLVSPSLCLSLSVFSPVTFNLGHIYFFPPHIFLLPYKQLIPLCVARQMNSLCWWARRRLLQEEVRGIAQKGHYGNKTEALDKYIAFCSQSNAI